MLHLCTVPRAAYPADGPMHVYAPRPPSETAAGAVSHSPAAAVYSSPSTPATTLAQQQHPAAVTSGAMMSPDQAASLTPSASPLMAAAQQGAVWTFSSYY